MRECDDLGSALTVNVATSQPACVVDVPLALSPYGLWCVLRLSQEVPVWLVKALWAILDDLPFYFRSAARRAVAAYGGRRAAA